MPSFSLSTSQEKDLINMTNGLFLLLLSISGGFTLETLGCKTQLFFSNNMFTKQILIFSMIYFTMDLTTTEHPHPLKILLKAFYVWLFFIMFTKMNTTFTSVAFILILSIFLLQKYKAYLNAIEDKTKNEEIVKAQTYSVIGLLSLVVIGFGIYYLEKKEEYGTDFTMYEFMFGNTNCKSLY